MLPASRFRFTFCRMTKTKKTKKQKQKMIASVSKEGQSVCVVAKQHTEWCWSVLLLPVQMACSTSVGASLKDLWRNANYILKWHHFKDLKSLKSEIQHTPVLVFTSCQTRKWQKTQFRNHWALDFFNFLCEKKNKTKQKTFRVSNGWSKLCQNNM